MLNTREILKFAETLLHDFGNYKQTKITLHRMLVSSLTRTQRNVLMVVWNLEPTTSSVISERLKKSQAQICNVLRDLDEFGLVTKFYDEDSNQNVWMKLDV
jgi:DNA-binding MarR family transcriptional regulator